MKIQSLKKELLELYQLTESILRESGFTQIDNSPQVKWNPDDPEEAMMYDEFHDILYHLLYVYRKLNYLQSPVVHSGILHKDRSGRYTLNGRSLKNGTTVEVFSFDNDSHKYKWKVRDLKSSSHLQGLEARIRELKQPSGILPKKGTT